MSRDVRLIVADIDALAAADPDDLDLDRVSDLADEFFASADAAPHLDAWFRFYERFPTGHGNGVFWSVLHGLEDQPGSGECAVASVRRDPTHYPVLMLQRELNAGTPAVGGVDLVGLLRAVAADDRHPAAVRADIEYYFEHHFGRA